MFNRFLILLYVVTGSSIMAQTNELRIAFVEVPMLSESNNNKGQGSGIISDIIEQACISEGIKYSPSYYPLKRVVSNFESDNIPFIVGSYEYRFVIAGKSPEIYKYIPCCVFKSSFFYYKPLWKKEIVYKDYSDLKGMRVGLPRGLPLKEVFEKAGIIVEEFNSAENAIRMLTAGRIDLLFEFDIFLNSIINSNYEGHTWDFCSLENASSKTKTGIIYKTENKVPLKQL